MVAINSPSLRTVALRSGQPLIAVVGVVAAEAEGWDDEDTAAALGLEAEAVAAIRAALAEKGLAGETLETVTVSGAPKTVSSGAERARRCREKKAAAKNGGNDDVTPRNDDVTPETLHPVTGNANVTPCNAGNDDVTPCDVTAPSPPSPPCSPPLSPDPSHPPYNPPQPPQPRKNISLTPPNFDAEFSEFWAAYPRKVGKGQALKAYRTACKTTPHAEIMAGVIRYATQRQGQDPGYTRHAATWLNGQCWLDEEQYAGVISSHGHANSNHAQSRKLSPQEALLAAGARVAARSRERESMVSAGGGRQTTGMDQVFDAELFSPLDPSPWG